MSEAKPHLRLVRVAEKPIDKWMCFHCKQVGVYDDFQGIDCTEQYEPCKYCGGVPLCKQDCIGIKAIFNNENLYVIGGPPSIDSN